MSEMLLKEFDLLARAPGGVARLRELILTLAARGKLVPQDPTDEPASVLLQRIRAEKESLIAEGKLKRDKPLPLIADEEKPFELPERWSWTRLREIVVSSEAGWSPSCVETPRREGRWGVLKVSAVSWGSFDSTANKELPQELAPRPELEVRDGDFLLSRANTADLVARSVLVKDPPPMLMLSDKIIRLKLSRRVDSRYINLFNNSNDARTYYPERASGTSSSMKNVSREVVLGLPVALPPLAEQSRIVARVDELMRLCDELEAKGRLEAEQHSRLLDTLLGTLIDSATPKELAANWQRVAEHFDLLLDRPEAVDVLEQTIFQLAVRGLLVQQNPSAETGSDLLSAISVGDQPKNRARRAALNHEYSEAEPPCSLPSSWAWGRFSQVADIASDLVSPLAHQDAWQVAPDCIEKGTGRLLSRRTVRNAEVISPNHRFFPGQILYSKIRPSLAKVVRVDFGGLCSADMYPIRARIDADFLLIYMLSDLFLQQVATAENRVKMPKLNQEALAGFVVAVPPLEEQPRIVARVTELRRLCADLRQRLSASQATQSRLAGALVESAAA